MPLVTFHGHSCISLKGEKGKIIIDPFLSGNSDAGIGAQEIDVDAILVTHGHNDHFGDTLSIAARCGALVIAPYELAQYCKHCGVKNVHSMQIGGSFQFGFGWVKLTQALHSSAVIEDGEIIYTGNPCGLLVEIDNRLIYHAGDTGLFADMKMIGDMYKIDVAFLPIGDNFTMGPKDALIAAGLLRPRIVVPIHYNTFGLIKQDAQKFKNSVEEETNSLCYVLKPAESFEV